MSPGYRWVKLFPRERRCEGGVSGELLMGECGELGVCGLEKPRDRRRGESGLNGLLDWSAIGGEGLRCWDDEVGRLAKVEPKVEFKPVSSLGSGAISGLIR
jgi:hypothetical protein